MRSLLVVIAALLVSTSFAQGPDPGAAAEKMRIDEINNRIKMQPVPVVDANQKPTSPRNVNLVKVQQKTDELNQLVKSLNTDMANLRKGMLAADMDQRLKRIEKLAKEIRQSLQ